jgi:hypothetical protein
VTLFDRAQRSLEARSVTPLDVRDDAVRAAAHMVGLA